MTKVREWLQGKKTYIVCTVTILGVVVAWADGAMQTSEALLAIAAALGGVTMKAGIERGK